MWSPLPSVRRLDPVDRAAVLHHFLTLTAHDRGLRFGAHLSDRAVDAYVAGIDLSSDVLFGVSDEDLSLVGVAHLARTTTHAELGLSVLPAQRNRGIGRSLLKRGYVHARNWGVGALYMHCLAANVAIIRLARDEGMEIVAETGEADAWLDLPAPDAASFMEAATSSCVAQIDHALRLQRASWGSAWASFETLSSFARGDLRKRSASARLTSEP